MMWIRKDGASEEKRRGISMQLQKELEGVTTVAIAGHIRPDGDSVGAASDYGLISMITIHKVEADMWLEKPDEKFSMIKGFSELREPVRGGAGI